jgi:hypothetical protein
MNRASEISHEHISDPNIFKVLSRMGQLKRRYIYECMLNGSHVEGLAVELLLPRGNNTVP